jgi:hypothetical protein
MASMAEIYPLQLLIASLAGVMNKRQAEVLEYLTCRASVASVSPDV